MPEHFMLELPEWEAPVRMENAGGDLWKSSGSTLLEIKQLSDSGLHVVAKDPRIAIDDEYLIELFAKYRGEQEKRIIDQEVSGVEADDEQSESIIEIPRPNFDPEQIRVDPKVYSLLDMIRFIDNARIDLSPDFQRHFVWKDYQQSRLIESLLLRIPLPVFYLSEDEEGLYQVVDGLQRLTTIHLFFKNKLKLKGLEYLEDCENKTFETLQPKYQRRIEDTQLSFNVIAPTTPISVKFEIFKRINEGGKPLNRQEIRNSMAKPHVRNFIRRLASSQVFKEATDYSVKSMRMEDQELVLRFTGFYLAQFGFGHAYRGEMESFLDDTLDFLNRKSSEGLLQTLEHDFYRSMRNAAFVFGKYAFRKVMNTPPEQYRRPLINKSLFTAWSVLLSKLDEQAVKEQMLPGLFIGSLVQSLNSDVLYYDSVTTGTNQANKLDYGFEMAGAIIAKHLQPQMSHA